MSITEIYQSNLGLLGKEGITERYTSDSVEITCPNKYSPTNREIHINNRPELKTELDISAYNLGKRIYDWALNRAKQEAKNG